MCVYTRLYACVCASMHVYHMHMHLIYAQILWSSLFIHPSHHTQSVLVLDYYYAVDDGVPTTKAQW